MKDQFQQSRDDESILSLINLCRDNANNNCDLLKLYDLLDRQNKALTRACQSLIEVSYCFMDSFSNIDERLKKLEGEKVNDFNGLSGSGCIVN